MPSYTTGSVKYNPETKAVAVKTVFPDLPDFADRQWGVMTVAHGGHYASNESVADWADMIVDPSWVPLTPPPTVTEGNPS